MFSVAAGRSEDGLPSGAGERGGREHDQTVQCVHQVRRVHAGDQPHGGGLIWHRYSHTRTSTHTNTTMSSFSIKK